MSDPLSSFSFAPEVNVFLRECQTTILETPLWVAVSAVVSAIFFSINLPFAWPFFALAVSEVLARLALKVINYYKPDLFENIKFKMEAYKAQFSPERFLALFPLVIIISPFCAAIFAGCFGAYRASLHQKTTIEQRLSENRSLIQQREKQDSETTFAVI